VKGAPSFIIVTPGASLTVTLAGFDEDRSHALGPETLGKDDVVLLAVPKVFSPCLRT
jgi:hypothetical protein